MAFEGFVGEGFVALLILLTLTMETTMIPVALLWPMRSDQVCASKTNDPLLAGCTNHCFSRVNCHLRSAKLVVEVGVVSWSTTQTNSDERSFLLAT